MSSQNPLKNKIITIDGYAATGKGTLANKLSEHYRMKFLDTGTIYRTVVYAALKQNVDLTNTAQVAQVGQNMNFDFKHIGNNQFATYLDGKNVEEHIRTPQVEAGIPLTAPEPQIRAALLERQKNFVTEWAPQYGVILDGRDCGARIAPNAHFKFFINGDPRIRAQRRQQQLAAHGIHTSLDQLHADMQHRDKKDAPNTLQTEDAHPLSCTELGIQEIFAAAQKIIEA